MPNFSINSPPHNDYFPQSDFVGFNMTLKDIYNAPT